MDYETFLGKVNKNDTVHKTKGPGSSECESIVRFVRGQGYFLSGLEEQPNYQDDVVDAWHRGLAGVPLGMHSSSRPHQSTLSIIYAEGRRYQQGEQQAGVSTEVEPTGEPRRTTAGNTLEWGTNDHGQPTITRRSAVGGEADPTQPRPEPESVEHRRTYRARWVRSPTSAEEGGVPSVYHEL